MDPADGSLSMSSGSSVLAGNNDYGTHAEEYARGLALFSLGLSALGLIFILAGGIGFLILNTVSMQLLVSFGTMFVTIASLLFSSCPVELFDFTKIIQKRHCLRISLSMLVCLYNAAYLTWSPQRRMRFLPMACCLWIASGYKLVSSLIWFNIMMAFGFAWTLCYIAGERTLPTWQGIPLPYFEWLMMGCLLFLSSAFMVARWIMSRQERVLVFYETLYTVELSFGVIWFLTGLMARIRSRHINGATSLTVSGLGVTSLAIFAFVFGRERIFAMAVRMFSSCGRWCGRYCRFCYWCFVGGVFGLSALICLCAVALLIYQTWRRFESGDGYNVKCVTVNNPSSRICFPNSGYHPLFSFSHGDGAGGYLFDVVYHDLQVHIASKGFVVPAHLSCWFDSHCENGETAFRYALQTIQYVEKHAEHYHANLSNPYTVSGHSTGARAALMLGALKDKPAYLDSLNAKYSISSSMRASLAKIGAVVAYHPDPMYEKELNPDIHDYDITDIPVFIFTGTDDDVEPDGSAWHDYQMISTPNKVFVNVKGADHYDDDMANLEAPFMAYFVEAFALGNASLVEKICGTEEGSLQKTLPLAPLGDINNGIAKNGQRDIAFQCSLSKRELFGSPSNFSLIRE